MFEAMAMIHSRKDTDEPMDRVKIIEEKDANHVIAEYNGKRCTAIYNGSVGLYYVDDKFGHLPDRAAEDRYMGRPPTTRPTPGRDQHSTQKRSDPER